MARERERELNCEVAYLSISTKLISIPKSFGVVLMVVNKPDVNLYRQMRN
jgi:hypothetical protein